jgi:hypothetical protein
MFSIGNTALIFILGIIVCFISIIFIISKFFDKHFHW